MLLRRVISHFRKQEWTAIAIDFLIVVLGVFVGLQVSNWNEAQRSKGQAERLLVRLESDLIEMRGTVEDQRQIYRQSSSALDAFIRSLEEGEAMDAAGVKETMTRIVNARLPPRPPLSFDEMLSAGRLDLIADTGIRDALRKFARTADINERASGFLAMEYTRASSELNRYLTYARTPGESVDENFVTVKSVDTERMWKNEEGRMALDNLFIFHTNMQALSENTLVSIDTVLAAIKEEQAP